MKKILVLVLVLFAVKVGTAGPPTRSSHCSAYEYTYYVQCSSEVSSAALSAENARSGYSIQNTDATYTVYRSTHAVTAATLATFLSGTSTTAVSGCPVRINAGDEWSDSVECYKGAIYLISQTGQSVRVEITEKFNE